jgi:two-component system cell cycle response regulator DivK
MQPHFLYIDNDLQSRHVIEVLITEVMGYSNLITLDSSENFLEQIHQLPRIPTVILLDIQMQPHDGYEMLKMLRMIPDYQQTTIIAVTASVMSSDIQKLKAAGFNGLIGKPIQRHLFPDLIRQILANESVWFVC